MNIFCGWRVNELGPPVNFEVIGNGEFWDALGQSVSQKTMNLARQGKTTCGSHAAQHPGPLGGKEKGAMMSNVSNKAKQQRVQIQRAHQEARLPRTALCLKSGAKPGKWSVDQQLHQKGQSTQNGKAKRKKNIHLQLSQINGHGIGIIVYTEALSPWISMMLIILLDCHCKRSASYSSLDTQDEWNSTARISKG